MRGSEMWSEKDSALELGFCVCVCDRGPLVLSDRGIGSEGMYLSLSDPPAPPLLSCSAAPHGATLLADSHGGIAGREQRFP